MRKKATRYTRAELLAVSGAAAEELAAVEAEGLLVPNRSRWPWGEREPWHTEAQAGVLCWLLAGRRVAAQRRGGHLAPGGNALAPPAPSQR